MMQAGGECMLRIYYADVSALPENPEGLPLSRYRLEQLNRVRPALRRRQGIGAELLLIRALRELDGDLALPLDILTEQGGKPYLACGTPHFSLSHSGRFVACALSDKTVGLDIQLQSPCRESLVHRFFAPEEQRYVLASEDRDAAFTEIWSKKESRLKADGTGLTMELSAFSVLDRSEGERIWHTRVGELHLSVCVSEGNPRPDCLNLIELP